jgi:hypothetical protein
MLMEEVVVGGWVIGLLVVWVVGWLGGWVVGWLGGVIAAYLAQSVARKGITTPSLHPHHFKGKLSIPL